MQTTCILFLPAILSDIQIDLQPSAEFKIFTFIYPPADPVDARASSARTPYRRFQLRSGHECLSLISPCRVVLWRLRSCDHLSMLCCPVKTEVLRRADPLSKESYRMSRMKYRGTKATVAWTFTKTVVTCNGWNHQLTSVNFSLQMQGLLLFSISLKPDFRCHSKSRGCLSSNAGNFLTQTCARVFQRFLTATVVTLLHITSVSVCKENRKSENNWSDPELDTDSGNSMR
jgi:hypothetical protein